jgi:NADP-dependent aldehyde dehydrogenase
LHKAPALPRALVQMFYQCTPEDGLWLVARPEIAAVAFTGSRASGLQIKEAADRAGKPAYLEMSSVNPVFVLQGALASKPGKVAEDFAASCLLAGGQMCTSPGLVFVPRSPEAEKLIADVAARLRAAAPGALLGPGGPVQLERAVATLTRAGASVVVGGKRAAGPGFRFENTLLRATGAQFAAAPEALQTEAFGSAALFVVVDNPDELLALAELLHGSLTGSVYRDDRGADEALYQRLAPILCEKVGRFLNDKMPTGVTVSPAMNHGGPFPATGHPGFTGVGFPAAIRRFAKLICFDHVR